MKLRKEDISAAVNSAAIRAIRAEKKEHPYSEQLDPPALSLDERGMILDCSKTFGWLFGFRRSDLVWHHVSTLFPQLAEVELVQGGQINSFLNYLCRCGQLYQAKNRHGNTISSNLNLVHIEHNGKRILRLIVHPLSNQETHDPRMPMSQI